MQATDKVTVVSFNEIIHPLSPKKRLRCLTEISTEIKRERGGGRWNVATAAVGQ